MANNKTASYIVGFAPDYFISAIIISLPHAVEYQRKVQIMSSLIHRDALVICPFTVSVSN